MGKAIFFHDSMLNDVRRAKSSTTALMHRKFDS